MRTVVRLKLDMATRVRNFCRDHPDTSQSWTDAMNRFEERLERAQALASQQEAGEVDAHAAVARRQDMRAAIYTGPLKDLARYARSASKDFPEVANRFRLARVRGNEARFLAAARTLAAEAEARKDVFAGYGMAADFPAKLTSALDGYEKVIAESHAAIVSHVSARADLDVYAQELIQLSNRLDAMIRPRFRGDAGTLAAWDSVRNVAWPDGTDASAESDKAGEVTPKAGEAPKAA